MIVGVLGNFLVLSNISLQVIVFELVKKRQAECYYEKDSKNYMNDHFLDPSKAPGNVEGDKCMKDWIDCHGILLFFSDITGLLVQSVIEILAIAPYVLRSLRI